MFLFCLFFETYLTYSFSKVCMYKCFLLLLCFLLSLFLLVSCSTEDSSSDSEDEFKEPNIIQIVFAGTYTGSGNCHKHDTAGCDIYLAFYDFTNKELLSVQQLTFEEDVAE